MYTTILGDVSSMTSYTAVSKGNVQAAAAAAATLEKLGGASLLGQPNHLRLISPSHACPLGGSPGLYDVIALVNGFSELALFTS